MAESLSLQQLKVKEIICEGYSVFISGKGGCGKSFILKEIMLELQQKQLNYYITATTGIAAVNIAGNCSFVRWYMQWNKGKSRAYIVYSVQCRSA